MFCGGALVAHLNVRSGSGSVKRKRFIVFAMTCGDVPAAANILPVAWPIMSGPPAAEGQANLPHRQAPLTLPSHISTYTA